MKKPKITVNLFNDPVKNRRMTPWEKEQEIQESKIWGHYVREYILDKPYYKDMIITPKIPFVNFDLNYKE